IDMPIPNSTCITGEVGLSGEIRPVGRIEQRIREAEKLGMDTIMIPKGNLKGVDTSSYNIRIVEISKVEEALRTLFT
ncbi:MAG: DNA repair protein RadA, partial [Duncaniella sp.]|nr:DNA repair protein RadA [Duncaniella sp.]